MAETDLDYAKLTGRFAVTKGDGPDAGENPDTVYCTEGEVHIRPLVGEVKVVGGADGPFTTVMQTIVAVIGDDGRLRYYDQPYVWVPDLTSPKVNPQVAADKATHEVTFVGVKAGDDDVALGKRYVRITKNGPDGDGVNDLTRLSPLSPGSATPMFRGPEGPAGPGASDEDIAGYVTDPDSATHAGLAASFASLDENGDLVIAGVPVEVGQRIEGPPVQARIDIVTAGKVPITSKETYVWATIAITGVPGVADYSGLVRIRGRGNYTWTLDKKPYKLKFDDDVSLMGMPAFDDWALLANRTDASLVNTSVAFTIAEGCDGLDWTPRSEHAHLYLNGEYDGVYQLTETVKRGTDRVNVVKAGATGLALTGGYLLEIGSRDIAEGAPGFTTTQGVGVCYDDPDGANTAQATYIQGAVQAFEDALYGPNWLDPTLGYARFIDRDSFIDWYLVEEVLRNNDSFFLSSCKLYKHRDTAEAIGRIHMGPVWDFDASLGAVDGGPVSPEGFYTLNGATWYVRLLEDPAFAGAVGTRWAALSARLLDADTGLAAIIDGATARVAAAGLADQERWDYEADWSALAAYKKDWLTDRIAWMSTQFETPGAVTGLTVTAVGASSVSLSWTAPATGVTPLAHDVEYSTDGGTTWTRQKRFGGTTTAITGLTPETAYSLRVRATTLGGPGAWSNTVTATTSAPVAPSIEVADDFNRADGALGNTPTGNLPWQTLNGSTWGVIGNQAGATATSGNALAVVDTASPDGRVGATVVTKDGGTGIAWRVVDANNFYLLLWSTAQSGAIYKCVNGGYEQIGMTANIGSGSTDHFVIEVAGPTFTIYRGNSLTEVAQVTDSTHTTGKFGLRADATSGRFDDFSVEPIA